MIIEGTTQAIAHPAIAPRWVPGFVLDLLCWARGHKPFPVPPYAWDESHITGVRWEFCARCGRFYGRKP